MLSINSVPCTSLHFSGILGAGMSALAQFCRWSGLDVSGSDRLFDTDATASLQAFLQGIGCHLAPQDGTGVTAQTSAVIVSSAIEQTNPEIAAATRLHIPVFHRSELLAAIVNSRRSIAVAGTSGKSTVTALLFHLLDACGLAPSLITGAGLRSLIERGLPGNALVGTSDLVVFEADESDGSIERYAPWMSLILNISRDHKPVEEIYRLFEGLAQRSRQVIINADASGLHGLRSTGMFGTAPHAVWQARNIICQTDHVTLRLDETDYRFNLPGTYNAFNLLAALSVCRTLGCAAGQLSTAAGTFEGLHRRFDRIATRRGVLVIDDYAHNPEKLGAVLTTAQQMSSRVCMLFQPHGFGPLKFMFNDLVALFDTVLRESDTLILLPVYYAGGTVQRDISSADLAAALRRPVSQVMAVQTRDESIARIAAQVSPGDLVLLTGARDPSLPLLSQSIAAAIDRTIDRP